jgi:polyisoprenoid-binding protein YceI
VIATLLALVLAAPPEGRAFVVDPAASTLHYRIVHKLHGVDAVSRRIEGKAVVQPDGRVLAMVRAPVSSFDSGDSNRDAHMQEALDVGAHPYVVVKATGRDATLAAGAAPSGPLTLEGELDLHGVKRPVSVPVQVERRPDGTFRARGSFDVSLDAHGIERPSLLFVKIEDRCRIDVDLVLREATP